MVRPLLYRRRAKRSASTPRGKAVTTALPRSILVNTGIPGHPLYVNKICQCAPYLRTLHMRARVCMYMSVRSLFFFVFFWLVVCFLVRQVEVKADLMFCLSFRSHLYLRESIGSRTEKTDQRRSEDTPARPPIQTLKVSVNPVGNGTKKTR